MAVTPNSIVTPQTIKTASCVAVTQSTDIDDSPTTSVELMTAGANGARVVKISSIPRATVTATMIGLYLERSGSGVKHLIDTALMSAHTVANTTEIPTTDWGYSEDAPILLAAGDKLHITIAVALAGGIVTFAQYQDY